MPSTQLLHALLHDTRLAVLLVHSLGPIPVWFGLFLGYHFFVPKRRSSRWPAVTGILLTAIPLPLALGVCTGHLTCPAQTASTVDFLTMTGALLIGWSLSAVTAAWLHQVFLRWHARRLRTSP